MFRSWMIATGLSLTLTLSVFAQNTGNAVTSGKSTGSVISFGHDPNCPGCRAFLAGHHGGCAHSPGCTACDAGAGAGTGDGAGMGTGTEADLGLGEDLLAADYGTGFGYDYAVPGMIGDFFGSTSQMLIGSSGQGGGDFFSTPNPDARTNVTVSGGDRRFKIAENYSPFPLDRFFFNYNNFHNALKTADGRNANFNRFVFGAEKTFFEQMMSLEVRVPLDGGLNATQVNEPTANNVSGEFGNVALAFKGLLWRTDTVAISAGMGVVLPTAEDSRLFASRAAATSIPPAFSSNNTTEVLTVHNDAYYLQPFIGLWITPNESLFIQLAGQLDIDACGNQIDMLNPAGQLTRAGVLQDQTLMFLDASMGYWLFHDPYSDAIITGVAPMVELHYSTTMQNTDVVDAGFLGRPFNIDRVTNLNGNMDILNLTGALRLEVAGQSYVTVFGVAPLRQAEEKLFDAEFGVQYTRRY